MRLPVATQTETLKGALRFVEDPARERAVRIDCRFAVDDWRAFLERGATTLSGTISCESFCAEAPLTGTLLIDPLRRRRLVYDFTFPAPDGATVRFYGEKRVEFLHLPRTMTTLHSRLVRDDVVIATGILRFALRDLPKFLASLRFS